MQKPRGEEKMYNDNRKIRGSRIFAFNALGGSIDTRIQEVQMMTIYIYKRGDKASWRRVRRSAHEQPCKQTRERGRGR